MDKILKIVIGVVIALFAIIILLKGFIFPRKYKSIVEQAAYTYNVDPNLIYAMIKQESSFKQNATSKSGAKGLMQLMESTANEFASRIPSINENNYDIYDPYNNIHIGTKYMSYLINYFDGNYYLAIIAYNTGLGRITDWIKDDPKQYDDISSIMEKIKYKETKNYLIKVIEYYEYYTKLY